MVPRTHRARHSRRLIPKQAMIEGHRTHRARHSRYSTGTWSQRIGQCIVGTIQGTWSRGHIGHGLAGTPQGHGPKGAKTRTWVETVPPKFWKPGESGAGGRTRGERASGQGSGRGSGILCRAVGSRPAQGAGPEAARGGRHRGLVQSLVRIIMCMCIHQAPETRDSCAQSRWERIARRPRLGIHSGATWGRPP